MSDVPDRAPEPDDTLADLDDTAQVELVEATDNGLSAEDELLPQPGDG